MSARKAIIEAPPPGSVPRRAVVVRPGDREGSSAGDVLAGLLGVLLLASTIVLGNVLPEDVPIEPQYKVNIIDGFYPDETRGDLAIPTATMEFVQEGTTVQFTFDVPYDNVWQAEFTVVVNDDVQGSDPEQYRMRIIAPNGTVTFYKSDATQFTAPPIQPPEDETPFVAPWISPVSSTAVTLNLVAKPSSEFVQPEDPKMSLEEIQAAAERQFGHNNAGTWTVEVQLVSSGDCPQPSPQADPQQNWRAVHCQDENDNSAVDGGNPISVTLVKFFYYDVEVQEP